MLNLSKYCAFALLIVTVTPIQKQEFNIFSPDVNTPIDVTFSTSPQEVILSITPNSTISLGTRNNTILNYSPEDDTLNTIYDLKLGNDIILYSQPNDILFQDVEQWKLIYLEDFQGPIRGWNPDTVSACGSSSNLFLGGHCNFANQIVTKTLTDLPDHRMIRLKFNFHFFGNWTGQSAYAKINEDYIWTESYNWCTKVLPWYCKKYGVLACGTEFPDKLSHPVEYMGKHYSPQLTLSFSTNLEDDPCKASWGIDDVQLYII